MPQAVKALLEKIGGADLIGFHGQTILHRPDQRWTWQIGDGALLARLTGIDVINDFRSADVAAGGQGARLMPLYHAAMARQCQLTRAAGGGEYRRRSAQVTYIDGETMLAFDTGPGNAPIDWMHASYRKTGGRRMARWRRATARWTKRCWRGCWPILLSTVAAQVAGPHGFRHSGGGRPGSSPMARRP